MKGNIIYLVVLFAFLVTFTSLPYLKTSISIHSPALLRPTTEVSSVRSLVNGRVKTSHVFENKAVIKNEVLFELESDLLAEREGLLNSKTEQAHQFMDDYAVLLSNKASENQLQTPLLRQALLTYNQKVFDAGTRLKKVRADYNRNLVLHRQKVIADSEFENFQFELNRATNELEQVKQAQLSQWQNELRSYERDMLDWQGQLAQLQKEKEHLVIKAPISGHIQNFSGLYPGSTVFANQDLAQISPDTSLMVECYVNPNDIGLLQKNMPVRFQVDAFNYNQWGMATGQVVDISNDIQLIQERPVFKVKCRLDKDHLQLKNGHKGFLKKGMTLQARFIVTERTLWQLLYDKVDDWVNPNTYASQ